MAKRNADKELTDRNWDQEEEGEEVSHNQEQNPFSSQVNSLVTTSLMGAAQ